MRFDLDTEQHELQEMVRRFAAEQVAPGRERVIRGETGFDADTWRRLTQDVGIVGLTVPESADGSGATAVEMAIALEELGRVCAPLPLVANAVATEVLARADQAGDALAAIADGATRVGLSTRWAAPVPGASVTAAGVTASDVLVPAARALTHVLLTVDDALHLVDLTGAGVRIDDVESLDLTQPLGRVTLDGAPARRLGGDADLRAVADDFGALYLAADSVGLARWCLDTAVEWSKEREQFGRPIGVHQSLKHMCADALVEIETAGALLYYAAFALATGQHDAALNASLAKQQATDAADLAARQAIQILGGIGFTWEHHAHLYLRRARANAVLCGDRDHHLGRVADAICAPYETKAGAVR